MLERNYWHILTKTVCTKQRSDERLRILHTGDWHLGKTLEGRSRLPEQEAMVDELVQLVKDEQIDLVLLAGDVYDTVNPPAAAEQLFYEALARLADGGKRRIVAIAGNHDNPDRLAAAAPLAGGHGISLAGLPSADPIEVGIARTGERAVIAALPYPSESRLRELLAEDADEQALRSAYSARVAHLMARLAARFTAETVNLAMSHLYVLGGAESDSERPIQVGGAYTVDPSAFAVGAQYVALGHLHRPQRVQADETVRYCGSPLAYSFSEAGQAKSVVVFDAAPGHALVSPKEMFLSAGRPLVRWQARGGIAEVQRWLDEGRDARAWIDLELHLREALAMEQIHEIRRRHGGIVNIRPVYPEAERETAVEAASSLSIEELFRRFYARQTGGAQPEPELIRLFGELIGEDAESEEEAIL
jgi:DNA repair protein SbcD/Mre11